jgi:hypothetical protein
MLRRNRFALVILAGSALLMTGASAQQPAPQASQPPADPTVVCPRDGPGGPGMGRGMGPGMGPGPMAGQAGGMMMHPEDMQRMHADVTALREEIRLLREELRSRR